MTITGESGAVDKGQVANSSHSGELHAAAEAETKHQIMKLEPLHLVIPTLAKAIAARK